MSSRASRSVASARAQEVRQTDRRTDRQKDQNQTRTRPTDQTNPETPLQTHRHCTDKLAPSAKTPKPYLPEQGWLSKRVRVTCSSLVDKRAPPPPATGGHAEACPRCPRTKDPGRPEGPRAPSLPEGRGTLRAKSVAAITKTETEKQESESRRPESLVALCDEASNKGERNASGNKKQKEQQRHPDP